MINKEILKKARETAEERVKVWETHVKLTQTMNELRSELCENIQIEDLRPMKDEDIFLGQLVFMANNHGLDKGFYSLVIDDLSQQRIYGDDSYGAHGSVYHAIHSYVLKD